MRHFQIAVLLSLAISVGVTGPALADRVDEPREKAEYVVSGVVQAIYSRETEGYTIYVVELKLDEVEKGDGLKAGDAFYAQCYRRKPGKGGLEFDSAGHDIVPKEGSRIKAYVKKYRHEGIYPNWCDEIAVKMK